MLKVVSGGIYPAPSIQFHVFFKRSGSLSPILPKKGLPVHKSSYWNHSCFQPSAFGSARQTFPSPPSQPKTKHSPAFTAPSSSKPYSTKVRHWYAGHTRAASQVHFTPRSRNYGFSSLMLHQPVLQLGIKLVEKWEMDRYSFFKKWLHFMRQF